MDMEALTEIHEHAVYEEKIKVNKLGLCCANLKLC